MTERERLSEEIYKIYYEGSCWKKPFFKSAGPVQKSIGRVADFIIADRKRIVKPLVELNIQRDFYQTGNRPTYDTICQSIDQVIKNAGVQESPNQNNFGTGHL